MKRLLFCTLTVVLMLFVLASCFGTESHKYKSDCATVCTDCGIEMREPLAEHTYDSCSDVECNACGEIRKATEHEYAGACAEACSLCGEKRETADAPHVFDSPCDSECNVCKATRAASEHVYQTDCDTDCEFCGALRITEHKYTNDCDKDCNVCSALRIPKAHVFTYPCSLTCNVCGAENPAPAACQYSYACDDDCNLCGTLRNADAHVYDHACDADCNVCGEVRAVNDHTYDDSCDADCNACGTLREGVHAFGAWRTKTPASCTSAEILARYCADCGAEETKEGASTLDHIYTNDCDVQCDRCGAKREITHTYDADFKVYVPVSCTTAEILERFCSVCGARETKIGRAALGHTYTNTCDTTCDREGCDYVRVITHTFGEWETKSVENCVDDEIEHRICSVCGAEETRVGTAALGHTPLETDCEICSVCGEASGFEHSFGAWETKTPEDCYNDEIENRICSACGVEETRTGTPSHGHAYADDCDAICENGCGFERIPPHVYDGVEDLVCNECGHNRECTGHLPYVNDCTICRICGEASGIEHAFGEWVTKTAENCTDAEIEHRVCDECGTEETRTGTAALGHTPLETDCEICSVCGQASGFEHSFGAWETKTPASCTEDEIERQICSICHKEATRTGDELAFDHDYDNNCDTTCNTCGAARPVEHDFEGVEWTEKTPADCNNAQILARKCLECGAEETKEGIGALGHTPHADNCTVCARCGQPSEIGHEFGDWVTKSEADCYNAEILHKVCGKCGIASTETQEGKPALKHTYTDACDAICDLCNTFERIPPHEYADEHDVSCELCGDVRACTGHKHLDNNCLVCEYCGQAIPGAEHTYSFICDTDCDVCGTTREASHAPSAADCTVCQYCGETIPGAAHVALDTDCTVCANCNAGTGKAHEADPTNCVVCKHCGKASGKTHTPDTAVNCTQCETCGKNLGTSHTDANADGYCDKCPQETLPGENWFPWAPL